MTIVNFKYGRRVLVVDFLNIIEIADHNFFEYE